MSPGDREKYRPRSPLEMETDTKRRKEEILKHVSLIVKYVRTIILLSSLLDIINLVSTTLRRIIILIDHLLAIIRLPVLLRDIHLYDKTNLYENQ